MYKNSRFIYSFGVPLKLNINQIKIWFYFVKPIFAFVLSKVIIFSLKKLSPNIMKSKSKVPLKNKHIKPEIITQQSQLHISKVHQEILTLDLLSTLKE